MAYFFPTYVCIFSSYVGAFLFHELFSQLFLFASNGVRCSLSGIACNVLTRNIISRLLCDPTWNAIKFCLVQTLISTNYIHIRNALCVSELSTLLVYSTSFIFERREKQMNANFNFNSHITQTLLYFYVLSARVHILGNLLNACLY